MVAIRMVVLAWVAVASRATVARQPEGEFLGVPFAGLGVHPEVMREIVHVKPHRHHHVAPVNFFASRRTRSSAEQPHPTASHVDVRPNMGLGQTIVGFGMLAKQFYGVDFKESTAMVDLVLTLQWLDNRTSALVPPGRNEVTLSQARAAALIWMPHVEVTNRDLEGTQITSTGVTLQRSGVVEKVQRLLAKVKNSFDISAFPFDSQSLRFRIASTTFMADELKLTPLTEEGVNGVKDGIFDGQEFEFISTRTHAFEEKDGILEKSRGELVIEVRRVSEPYVKNLLVQCLLLVAIAYTVFLFPLAERFVMPRVATSVITFMSLMVLSYKTSRMLPVRGSTSWLDVFEENCQILMFTTLCLNIIVEVIEHESRPVGADAGSWDMAKRMQFELRCGLPVVEVIVMCICFFRTDGTGLWWLGVWTKVVWFGCLIPYLAYSLKRLWDKRQAALASVEASK